MCGLMPRVYFCHFGKEEVIRGVRRSTGLPSSYKYVLRTAVPPKSQNLNPTHDSPQPKVTVDAVGQEVQKQQRTTAASSTFSPPSPFLDLPLGLRGRMNDRGGGRSPRPASAVAVTIPSVWFEDLRTAADFLNSIATRGEAIEVLKLRLVRWWPEHRVPSELSRLNEEARSFHAFVERLGRDDVVIHSIWFDVWGWRRLPLVGMERLFGQVLPSQPTVRSIRIEGTYLPGRFMRLYAESVSATTPPPLRSLRLAGEWTLDHEDIRAIATMVDRLVALEELVLEQMYLDGEHLKRLCQAVARHKNLRRFSVYVDVLGADTLDRVASSSASSSSASSLRELSVTGHLVDIAGIANLARQLRTNTTLSGLKLLHFPIVTPGVPTPSPPELFRSILEVLETYNFTIERVFVHLISEDRGSPFQRSIERLVRRNKRIRRALAQLEPRSYRVEPAGLAPRVLGMVSGLPTLLYRFVRRGNAQQLLVQRFLRASEAHAGGRLKKRGRP